MAGVNKAIIVGNLGKDPETRTTQDGKLIATLSIATSESWKDKNTGERREKTEWHRIVIFNDALANVAKNYLRKGAKIYVEGQIQTRKWTDQSGIERYVTEIVLQGFGGQLVMLDGKRDSEAPPAQQQSGAAGYSRDKTAPAMQTQAMQAQAPLDDGLDDEIPF